MERQYSLRIDNRQKISAALDILRETRRCRIKTSPSFYRSAMRECLVSAYKTYEEEQIFNGDLLTAVFEEKEE